MRTVLWLVAAVTSLIMASAAAAPLDAQTELARAERGPRFLVESRRGAVPREVDVRTVPVLRQRVSLNQPGATVGELLAAISRQTGLKFLYSHDVLPSDKSLGLRADSITVAAALTEILVGAGVDVLLSPGRQMALVRQSGIQGGTLTGQVTDGKSGEGISGVDVSLEGTRWRTATDAGGRYRFADVLPGSYTLVARRIGYAPERRTVTVTAGQEAPVDVTLQPAAARLGDVVVTATKREANVQDIPMSISVVAAEEIERRGLVGMGDYLNSVPGVSVLDQGAGNASVVMRGLAINPNNLERSIAGVYFGETPISGFGFRGGNADIKMVDFERAEVLKGPQGTLYGASSMTGTVRNIPALPDLQEREGSINIGASNTARFGSGNSEITGVLSVPLVQDKLAVRAVGYRFSNSGYYKNVAGSDPVAVAAMNTVGASAVSRDDVGSDEYTGGRISVLWQPTDKLTLKLSYLRQEIDQDGWPQADLQLGVGAYQQSRLQVRHPPEGGDFGEPEFGNEELSDDIDIANAVIEYDLGWASVLSSSSWVKESAKAYRELAYFFGGTIPWTQPLSFNGDGFIQEVRLVSQLNGPVQFTAGAYYEDVSTGFENWGIWGGDPARNVFGNSDQVVFLHNFSRDDEKQKALFGEISYSLTERLKLTAGARVFSFDKKFTGRAEDALFTPGGGASLINSDGSDATYKAGVDLSPNRSTLIYASWSEGFRLGRGVPAAQEGANVCDRDGDGFYDGSGGVSTGAREIDSDFVDNYELGAKGSFFNNRLRLNGSVYQAYWKGIPQTIVFDFCPATLNAGKAETRGVEFDASYYVRDGLLATLGGSYVNAELTEDAPFVGNAGDRLPGSPEYNFHGGLQYDFSIVGNNAFLRGDYTYVGGFYNNLQEAGQKIGDYSLLSMRTGVSFGSIGVEVFANNLTNENALTWRDAEDAVVQKGYLLRPRTIGTSVGYRF